MSEFQDKKNKPASTENLDAVLSSIRKKVTNRVEKGVSPLSIAFDDLREQMIEINQKLKEQSIKSSPLTAEMLEELIRKIAHPMLELILKNWAEKNLPILAEQIIREEIEKISDETKSYASLK